MQRKKVEVLLWGRYKSRAGELMHFPVVLICPRPDKIAPL